MVPIAQSSTQIHQVPTNEPERFKAALLVKLGDEVYSAWFNSLQIESFAERTLTVSVANSFLRHQVGLYTNTVLACATPVYGITEHIRVVVRESRPAISVVSTERKQYRDSEEPDRAANVRRKVSPPNMNNASPDVRPAPTLSNLKVPNHLTIAFIRYFVGLHFKVSKEDMVSLHRKRDLTWARQVGMYLTKQTTLKSMPEIGRGFGNRDHTTVVHAVRKVENMMKDNPRIRAEVAEMLRFLRKEDAPALNLPEPSTEVVPACAEAN